MNLIDQGRIEVRAGDIGDILERNYPRIDKPFPHINPNDVEDIASVITFIVAEILQSWLDAGSERDVTFEELGPAILDHVKGWSEV